MNDFNIKEHGFECHKSFLKKESIEEIVNDIQSLNSDYPKHGIRNAEKKLPTVKKLVNSALLLDTAQQFLTGKPSIVRVIIFDKTPDKNWLVAWHQDKTISVSDKVDIDNWGPWTFKDGIHHVQPSINVLQDMVTLRIHLDDANENNGCLIVIPKSHNLGILSKSDQERVISESTKYTCVAKAGDLLIIRPQLLHSSSKGTEPSHRRIVHVEYSSFQLPQGLGWA